MWRVKSVGHSNVVLALLIKFPELGSLTFRVTRGVGRFHSSGFTFSNCDVDKTGCILNDFGSLSRYARSLTFSMISNGPSRL